MHAALVIFHILGAAIWTGGHLILSIGFLPSAMREKNPQIILDFESKFERIGIPALVIQLITGVMLMMDFMPEAGESMSGHVAGSLGAKAVLLLATVGLAAHARLRLIPKLTPENLKVLAAHIISVTIIAVLFVVVGVSLQLAQAGG